MFVPTWLLVVFLVWFAALIHSSHRWKRLFYRACDAADNYKEQRDQLWERRYDNQG